MGPRAKMRTSQVTQFPGFVSSALDAYRGFNQILKNGCRWAPVLFFVNCARGSHALMTSALEEEGALDVGQR